jgi:alkyl hydroperoxide reductase subunit AhpC
MALAINDTAPDFEAQTTEGKIKFHDWIGDKWAVLFSHPKDFTPVCTTELGYMAKIKPEFDKRGVKIIGLSVDPVERHAGWAADIKETQGFEPNYPMIGDVDYNVSKLYGMLPAAISGDPTKRTAADNQTVRNVFIIGPDKKIKLILVYPMTVGRNFDEVLRVIDSLQLGAKHKVATPVNWKSGDDVIIAGSVTDDDAKKLFPQGWKSPKPYIGSCRSRVKRRTGSIDCRGVAQAAPLFIVLPSRPQRISPAKDCRCRPPKTLIRSRFSTSSF